MPQTPRTELTSDPLAPLTSRSRAWVALAESARTISDFSRSLLPGAAQCTLRGVVTGDAVHLATLTQRLIAAAIVMERTSGASWDELADPLGVTAAEAREQWEPTVAQRETGLEAERAASLTRTSCSRSTRRRPQWSSTTGSAGTASRPTSTTSRTRCPGSYSAWTRCASSCTSPGHDAHCSPHTTAHRRPRCWRGSRTEKATSWRV
jgi:hypothetical protein